MAFATTTLRVNQRPVGHNAHLNVQLWRLNSAKILCMVYIENKPFSWIYDNSPTDNWPTRRFTDSVFSPTADSLTWPLTDTTSHRHNLKKKNLKNHRLTRRHSPTVTIPGKWMKENLSVNHKISLFVKADKKIPSVGIIICFRHHFDVWSC